MTESDKRLLNCYSFLVKWIQNLTNKNLDKIQSQIIKLGEDKKKNMLILTKQKNLTIGDPKKNRSSTKQ